MLGLNGLVQISKASSIGIGLGVATTIIMFYSPIVGWTIQGVLGIYLVKWMIDNCEIVNELTAKDDYEGIGRLFARESVDFIIMALTFGKSRSVTKDVLIKTDMRTVFKEVGNGINEAAQEINGIDPKSTSVNNEVSASSANTSDEDITKKNRSNNSCR